MYDYTVERAEFLTPTVFGLRLVSAGGGKLLSFQPGQYAAISFVHRRRPTVVRCFSIASSPTEQNVLEFGIRVGGKFTKALTTIQPGTRVRVRGPFGNFVLDSMRHSRVVMLAGGIGITPFMSMLRFAAITGLTNDLKLVYSIRSATDAAYLDDLRHIQAQNSHVQVHFAVGEGATDTLPGPSHIGRITPDVVRTVCGDDLHSTTFFLCGPPPFMASLVEMLREDGVPERSIITEAFSQNHGRQSSKVRGWPFNIYLLGAFGTAAASVSLMANDLLKAIPPTLLPTALSSASSATSAGNVRQQEVDTIINQLSTVNATGAISPGVSAANQEVSDAQAKADAINAQNAANAGTTYTPPVAKKPTSTSTGSSAGTSTTSTSSSGSTASTPAAGGTTTAPTTPTQPTTPVCVTSGSGVTTCH